MNGIHFERLALKKPAVTRTFDEISVDGDVSEDNDEQGNARAPTNDNEAAEDRFYNRLPNVFENSQKKTSTASLIGDFDANIGLDNTA